MQKAVDEIAQQIGNGRWSAVIFFASPRHAMADLATCMQEAFPDAVTAGCSTMGEIGPTGLARGTLVAMALDERCGVAALPIDQESFLFDDGGRIVAELIHRVRGEPAGLSPQEHVFITLTDGLSGKEELLVASLGTHAPGIPLVGGSAGDDWRFERTWVALNGQAFSRAAIVLLIEPRMPFYAFHMHHFKPTERRMVVTAADPDRRLVHELDGWPAVDVLADLLGISGATLRSVDSRSIGSLYQVAFAFRVGERYYLRSIMTVQEDSLLMGGAVEEGAVLRVMQAGDLVEETRRGVYQALHRHSAPAAGLLLFNCGGRMFEARNRGVTQAFGAATCPSHVPVCGFTTYGEQFGPMQVNSTLTGIVFFDGAPERSSVHPAPARPQPTGSSWLLRGGAA